MASPVPADVTQLLRAWSQGDEGALQKLIPVVYRELRRLAHRYMSRERADHTVTGRNSTPRSEQFFSD